MTLPLLLLLSGRSSFYAESGFGTPATPLRAAPLTSRSGYEAGSMDAGFTRDRQKRRAVHFYISPILHLDRIREIQHRKR